MNDYLAAVLAAGFASDFVSGFGVGPGRLQRFARGGEVAPSYRPPAFALLRLAAAIAATRAQSTFCMRCIFHELIPQLLDTQLARTGKHRIL